MSILAIMRKEVNEELMNHIMPFWMNLRDDLFGGYYGWVDYDLKVEKDAPKGGIATARLLWSFSSVYRVTNNEVYLNHATHAYEFLKNQIIDHEYGGLLWMVDAKGKVLDGRKHVYAQAFGIYGLTEYYRVTKDSEVLDMAKGLFQWIESVGYDSEHNVYKEEFTRDYIEVANEMLSENGIVAEATTNTQLHILEAYTNLYRVWPDMKVKKALKNLLDIFLERIYKAESGFLKVFYNKKYEEIIDMQSYGHDIEASWLINEALDVLGETGSKYHKVVAAIAENISSVAIAEDGSLMNECENGIVDEQRIWWVQAEAMVGFLNMYGRTEGAEYLDRVLNLWNYTKSYMIDTRDKSEWFWAVDKEGESVAKPIGESWKTPYHNARFCIEVIQRIDNLLNKSVIVR